MRALRYAAEHRGLVAQWFGVLGPAAAWSVQFLVSYNVADTGSCSPAAPSFLANGAGLKLVVAVVSSLALAVTVLAGAVSYHCWKRPSMELSTKYSPSGTMPPPHASC